MLRIYKFRKHSLITFLYMHLNNEGLIFYKFLEIIYNLEYIQFWLHSKSIFLITALHREENRETRRANVAPSI